MINARNDETVALTLGVAPQDVLVLGAPMAGAWDYELPMVRGTVILDTRSTRQPKRLQTVWMWIHTTCRQ